jgi:hypothetical protein
MSQEVKRRGRKKKEYVQETLTSNPSPSPIMLESDENIVKKRGRKPKGGKLIIKSHENINVQNLIPNMILHLKCSIHDLNEYNEKRKKNITNPLNYNPTVPPEIMSYMDNEAGLAYSTIESSTNINSNMNIAYSDSSYKMNDPYNVCKCNNGVNCNSNNNSKIEDPNTNVKNINIKLNELKTQLFNKTLNDKKSACFWCSYDFDNPECYIPKNNLNGEIYGYGSFCRPECAVAFLMKENMDDSVKFERYQLLNQIYGKIYNFKRNIKPAPNPYYLLDKYYGNLTIQQYRKLLKTEHMLLVIDKPMTRILPELHDDNENYILNIYGIENKTPSANMNGAYKVKRQSEKQTGPTKNSIIKEQFGITT